MYFETDDFLLYLAFLLDYDNCALSERCLSPYWTSLAILMGGEEKLETAISQRPFISDYFIDDEKDLSILLASELQQDEKIIKIILSFISDYFSRECAFIEAVASQVSILMLVSELSRGEQVKKIRVQENIETILSQIEAVRPKKIEDIEVVEMIYRVAFLVACSERIIKSNLHLLNYMKNTVLNLKKKFPEKRLVVILASSSRRESTRVDIKNYIKHRNGLISLQLPFFYQYGLKNVLSGLGCTVIFLPILSSDEICELKIGDSLFERKDFDSQTKDFRCGLAGNSKTFLLSGLMARIALTPDDDKLPGEVYCTMIDDESTPVTNKIYTLIKDYSGILPDRVKLTLASYVNGESIIRVFPELSGSGEAGNLYNFHHQVMCGRRKNKIIPIKDADDYLREFFSIKKSSKIIYPFLKKIDKYSYPKELKLDNPVTKFYDGRNLKAQISESNWRFCQSMQLITAAPRSKVREIKRQEKIRKIVYKEEFSTEDRSLLLSALEQLGDDALKSLPDTENEKINYLLTEKMKVKYMELELKKGSSEFSPPEVEIIFEDRQQKYRFKIRLYQIILDGAFVAHIKENSSSFIFSLFPYNKIKSDGLTEIAELNNKIYKLNGDDAGNEIFLKNIENEGSKILSDDIFKEHREILKDLLTACRKLNKITAAITSDHGLPGGHKRK